MADMPVYGVFKEEMNLAATGDPYDKPFTPFSRHVGKQFSVPDCSAVTGHGRDAWFDKNLQLVTPSDSYRDPLDLPNIVSARNVAASAGSPKISDKPFRPSHPAAKSGRAAGSLYGTFGPRELFFESEADGGLYRPETAPAGPERRSIYTNNPKKGTAGYPDQYRLLSGESFKYVPDEYQRARALERTMKAEARARIAKPFWGGTKAPVTFTSDRELFARPPPAKQPSRRPSAPDRPAWRPNNPAPRGPYCGLLSQPAHIPCPEPPDKPAPRSPPRPFVPPFAGHKRLSMWTVNPFEREARPPHERDGAVFL